MLSICLGARQRGFEADIHRDKVGMPRQLRIKQVVLPTYLARKKGYKGRRLDKAVQFILCWLVCLVRECVRACTRESQEKRPSLPCCREGVRSSIWRRSRHRAISKGIYILYVRCFFLSVCVRVRVRIRACVRGGMRERTFDWAKYYVL